jgi:hypothetical protein
MMDKSVLRADVMTFNDADRGRRRAAAHAS